MPRRYGPFAHHSKTFHADSIRATATWLEDSRTLGPASKTAVARDILALIRERLDARTTAPRNL